MVEVEIPAIRHHRNDEGRKSGGVLVDGIVGRHGIHQHAGLTLGTFVLSTPVAYAGDETLLQRIDAMAALFEEAFGYLTTNFDMTFRKRTPGRPIDIGIGTNTTACRRRYFTEWPRNPGGVGITITIELNSALFETKTKHGRLGRGHRHP